MKKKQSLLRPGATIGDVWRSERSLLSEMTDTVSKRSGRRVKEFLAEDWEDIAVVLAERLERRIREQVDSEELALAAIKEAAELDRQRTGKMGAEVRHAGNRGAKKLALKIYERGGWPSKARAAEVIAIEMREKHGQKFEVETIRDWLYRPIRAKKKS